jgi:hypothetical protein
MAGPSELSKTQVDRLGDRLRKGDIHEDDLRLTQLLQTVLHRAVRSSSKEHSR